MMDQQHWWELLASDKSELTISMLEQPWWTCCVRAVGNCVDFHVLYRNSLHHARNSREIFAWCANSNLIHKNMLVYLKKEPGKTLELFVDSQTNQTNITIYCKVRSNILSNVLRERSNEGITHLLCFYGFAFLSKSSKQNTYSLV